MNSAFQQAMAEATRLTRAGDLQGATALIQSALAGQAPPAAARTAPSRGADVVDVEARVLDDGALALPLADAPARPAPEARAEAVAAPAAPPRRAEGGIRSKLSRLADALSRVSRGPKRPPGEPDAAPDQAPAPAAAPASTVPDSFVDGTHTEAGLTRQYKLYVPPARHGAGLPLVVMLHGCTQHPDDFAAGTGMNDAAREQGFFVLYPAQAQKANPQRCWNWFKHNHQARGRGEPALLAGMTRAVMARHGIDPQRVYVAGLSAGGAMAAILGDTYPDLFAAVGVHSGLPAGAARDLPSALAAMQGAAPGAGPAGMPGLKDLHGLADLPGMSRLADLPGLADLEGLDGGQPVHAEEPAPAGPMPPTIVFHGDQDGTVHPSNGERALNACTDAAAATDTERGRSRGGRSYTRRVWRDAAGQPRAEHWTVHGAGHAWSGGHRAGSYTDAAGPEATEAMLRFFRAQRLRRT
ncbi:extracellular catalytic domain type 1 short-chain-length polyhydroxyalkanoate depolymerase [Azohydromonas aeria]|uniref:extracellular catalytic domain type 1 short-chain-length polyhydroxyalkanoate depolymerase n=1 Tax=Azohydromonas aeria TaxID=2590212 RepID=UPI001E638366|nr:PHB depolymerase family esterase [Azohydromonas aeria]